MIRDPGENQLFEDVEGNGALTQDDVVKFPDVEFVSQFLLGSAAQLADFQLADLVGQRLAGPRDVTVDFVDDVELRFRGVIGKEFDRLLARPLLR